MVIYKYSIKDKKYHCIINSLVRKVVRFWKVNLCKVQLIKDKLNVSLVRKPVRFYFIVILCKFFSLIFNELHIF